MTAEIEYEKIVKLIEDSHEGQSGQMFGKRCIKVNGKAGIAFFKDCVVFKLSDPEHAMAQSLSGSVLWDPSGKGRAMKEWVQVTMDHKTKFKKLAKAAADYVG